MIQILRLDEQRRFEISKSTVQKLNLDLEAAGSVYVWAALGGAGQLQLLPTDSSVSKARDALDRRADDISLPWEAAGDEHTATLRQLAMLLRISCRPRSQSVNVRITLPADVIHLGLFAPPQSIVVLSIGSVVEIWSTDRWRAVAGVTDLRRFTDDVQSMLTSGTAAD